MYSRVFVAGTFDNLHDGHEMLLARAFEAGEHVIIGLTPDVFVKTYKKDFALIKPYADREKELRLWLTDHGYSTRVTIISIENAYEPAASMPDVEVIVVTPDNKARGEEINEIRKSRGLVPFALLVVPLVPAEDQKPISSSRVRAGEIDRTGRLIMPDNLRPELGLPLGTILTGDEIGSSIEKNRSNVIITVGDQTAKTMLTAGIIPNLTIVDFRVERKPFPDNDEKFSELNLFKIDMHSGPGFIASQAVETIQKWAHHPAEKMILAITGEEDLLTLPAVAYGPVGAVLYYGQPGKGMVEVTMRPDKQQEAIALLDRFSVK